MLQSKPDSALESDEKQLGGQALRRESLDIKSFILELKTKIH